MPQTQNTINLEVTNDHAVPVSVPSQGTATILNASGDILYYGSDVQVSSTSNDGSLTASQSQSFSRPTWVRSASLSTVRVTLVAPGALLTGNTADDTSAISAGTGLKITAVGGLASFNTRTGAITLTKSDVTGTGLAASDIGAGVTVQGTTGTNLGATQTIDFASSPQQKWLVGTLNANLAVTTANRVAGSRASLELTQDATGGRTLTVDGQSVPITPTALALSIVEVRCPDASTTAVVVPGAGVASAQLFIANGTYAIPATATMLEIVCRGGGGGGGGAGSAAAAQLQSGAGGGGAGQVVSKLVPVGSATSLTVTIGAGASGGTGGTAGGNAGAQGNVGSTTSVTGTGISVSALGGSGGDRTIASSTALVGGGLMGPIGSLGGGGLTSTASTAPGCGGPTATSGGAGVTWSGAGGGGGGPATATLGGGGGAAGTATVGGQRGSSGASGTAAGVVGADATANTSAGGGGGGGGAAGTGAGGTGGAGGSGDALIKVVG